MENILNKKIELLPVELKEGYIHCDICKGITWLISDTKHLVKCNCYEGLIRVCDKCNTPHPKTYTCRNEDCIAYFDEQKSIKAINKATQLQLDDKLVLESAMFYSYDYDGHKEGYFDSVEDYLEYLYDNEIELTDDNNTLWLCNKETFSIDVDSLLERELEEHYEDAYNNLVDIEELHEFIYKWCDKQDITTYYSSNKYYIKVNKEEK